MASPTHLRIGRTVYDDKTNQKGVVTAIKRNTDRKVDRVLFAVKWDDGTTSEVFAVAVRLSPRGDSNRSIAQHPL